MSGMGVIQFIKEKFDGDNTKNLNEAEIDAKSKELEECTKAGSLFQQLLFSNAVDNFNCYLSDIVGEILLTDPRPIYGRKFDVAVAFNVGDIESLRSQIIEKQILDMGYQNIADLTDFLQKNFGISSLSHWLTKLRLNRIIQTRNIITHNRGIVNGTYLFRSKSRSEQLGQSANVRFPLRTSNYLDSIVERLDQEIAIKFEIG